MNSLISPRLMSTILSAGYNIDFIDADAVDSVGLGSHAILLLPPTDRIPARTLSKISAWVAAGGKVISVGRAPSVDPEGKASSQMTELSHRLFDPANASFVTDESGLTNALHKAATPDLQLTSDQEAIGFIRRKLPAADIYFVANTGNHPIQTTASFGTGYQYGEQWDPDTARSSAVPTREVSLKLAPYESRVFVFSSAASRSAADHEAETQIADLSADWQLRYAGTGKTESQATLTDWIADPETRFYSGEVVYSREFNLANRPSASTYLQVDGGTPLPMPIAAADRPALLPNGLPDPRITLPGPGMQAYYDGPIREAAIVFINGKRAGSLWHPPYRLDVTSYLQAGRNRIEIDVYNTAINAWAAQPPHDYRPLIAKYGDRFQMQDLDKVHPVPSGLLGAVHLVQ